MYDFAEIKKNLKVLIDNVPYTVVDFQFVKPGKGQAFNRTKLRNLITGAMLERTFKSNESLVKADIEARDFEFSYADGDKYVFMDKLNFEQLFLGADQLADARFFLQDNMPVSVLFWNEKPIGVTPPSHVEMQVAQCDPGARGDTATNVSKPAKMAPTMVEVAVPIFINEGDWLKIDTRTGEYVERINRK